MRAVVGCRNDFRNESPGFSSLGLIRVKRIQRFRILLVRGSLKEFGSFSRGAHFGPGWRGLNFLDSATALDWADRLVQCRNIVGLSQSESAARIGVDPSALARWERGEREPKGVSAELASCFLTSEDAAWSTAFPQTA
jgi:DNA-binding XRE family transcriptional regulator